MSERSSVRGRRWLAPKTIPITLSDSVPLPRWLRSLVEQRGLGTEDALERYLEPSLGQLDDPNLMAGMTEACRCLADSIETGQRITVYGDYDVDGVCASALLVEFLRSLEASVDYYIPDRRLEGYGVHVEAVREIAQRSDLLITVDCGITAHEALAEAHSAGLDVIVVDHHQVPEQLPIARACLNPQRQACSYPFKSLCATGVAFLLAVGLRRSLRERAAFEPGEEPDVRTLLDLVALASGADMVPMSGTNRVLVAAGLRQINKGARAGIRALIDVAGVDPNDVRARDLGFRLGPRINAKGRLDHAAEAVDLMLTPDHSRARHLAAALDQANAERRAVERRAQDEAIAQVEADGGDAIRASSVAANSQWHPGVLGLVASRLVARFQCPVVVIGEGGKGSARSIDGCNIHEALAQCGDSLQRFGGHRAAAGLTLNEGTPDHGALNPEALEDFRRGFDAAVRAQLGAPPYVRELRPDLEVDAEELSLRMVDELALLEPFGQDNPEPLLFARGLRVREKRAVGGGEHLKLSLGEGGFDAIGFGLGEHVEHVPDEVDVVFRMERNVFRGRESLQLRIDDQRASDEG